MSTQTPSSQSNTAPSTQTQAPQTQTQAPSQTQAPPQSQTQAPSQQETNKPVSVVDVGKEMKSQQDKATEEYKKLLGDAMNKKSEEKPSVPNSNVNISNELLDFKKREEEYKKLIETYKAKTDALEKKELESRKTIHGEKWKKAGLKGKDDNETNEMLEDYCAVQVSDDPKAKRLARIFNLFMDERSKPKSEIEEKKMESPVEKKMKMPNEIGVEAKDPYGVSAFLQAHNIKEDEYREKIQSEGKDILKLSDDFINKANKEINERLSKDNYNF